MKYTTANMLKSLKNRKKTSHKGDNGKVLVVAGSEDYPGAAALSAAAALAILRSGADHVRVATPSKVAWIVNTFAPDIITTKLPGKYFTGAHMKKIMKLSKDVDVVLIGPGIGNKSNSFIKSLTNKLTKQGMKMVIDADANNVVDLNKINNAIITPHHREFEKLLKNSRLTRANLQKKLKNNVIILKGSVDEVISKSTTTYNKCGNAVMTKAGTGDVLAGLCSGIYAQSNSPSLSANTAAYINGKTADYLRKKLGRTFTASDIVANIHKIYK